MSTNRHQTKHFDRPPASFKIPFVALLAFALTTQPLAHAQQTGLLVVELTGMTSDDGRLVYAMWSGPENWLESDPVQEGSVPVEGGMSEIRISDLPHGEYAMSVYHDRNGNSKLDTGFFRIPKEPIGTSNDAKIRFGPPKYEDAVFSLNEAETTITIAVKKLF